MPVEDTTYGCAHCNAEFTAPGEPKNCPMCGWNPLDNGYFPNAENKYDLDLSECRGGPKGGFAIGGFDRT